MNCRDPHLIARNNHGFVRQCMAGCVHLTFENVTLHFGTQDEFEAMADVVEDCNRCRQPWEGLEIGFGRHSYSLISAASAPFAELVLQAREEMKWRRGDLSLSDADITHLMNRPEPNRDIRLVDPYDS